MRQGRRHWPPSVKGPEVFSPRAQSYNSLGVHSTGVGRGVGNRLGGGWGPDLSLITVEQGGRSHIVNIFKSFHSDS